MNRLALQTIFLACGAFFASGCVYKMSIQQGNYLVTDSVSQLKEGMTRSQVRFLLGTPMVPDAFDDSRWDYFYYYYNARRQPDPLKRRLTVYFADERVQRIENQGVPTKTNLDQLEKDLQKAIEANKKKRKGNAFTRMFGGDKPAEAPAGTPDAESTATPAAEAKSDVEKAAEAPPDPVPASAPLPVPAGTPSGQP
jgi:outer membrane protein assembly factor BamE